MNPITDMALFSPDGIQWQRPDRPFDWPTVPNAQVTKIVIGTPPRAGEDRKEVALSNPLPANLTQLFPRLTHLHLWQIAGLETLPPLPATIECLDLRGCTQLKTLPDLPPGLETLVVADCPLATHAPHQRTTFRSLAEIVLSGSIGFAVEWVHAVLDESPQLRLIDLSNCQQITFIPEWPTQVVDVRLDGCAALTHLPAKWPPQLRRVGLRGAKNITEIPDFPATLDYVDLAHTESLRAFPKPDKWPRTLFLFESGVLMPPASEHGETADENVASRTAAYFEDVAIAGQGEVKRCKLLVLGNGSAGKTCLSLALAPNGDPADIERIGSTHGIQFWEWDFRAKVAGHFEPIHLHLWDFGGQEIYHNTHRLFMSKGAVFVVVWKPEQDGKQPASVEGEYQDEWRPLQYWLDFIRLACRHEPRIAIVCSHHAQKTELLENQLRDQVRPESLTKYPCVHIDSRWRAGELPALRSWMQEQIGQVVATQGVAVPSYWEIAQDMVEQWVKRMQDDAPFATEHNHLHPDRFREYLWAAITHAIANDKSDRFGKLAKSIESQEFTLNDDRLHRTLAFLTHSGWAYWDPKLFEGRVIIGQQWALDGLYAVLDRRPSSPVYRALARSDGRFTLEQLGIWRWNDAGYSETEQQLLLTFMERCGLCFRLRAGPESWREQDVFVSFEHLPTARELQLEHVFQSRLRDLDVHDWHRKVPSLHKHHWQNFLCRAGTHYGQDAQYALDGFYLENQEGEKLLVLCHLDKTSGLGGEIEIRVGGQNAAERLKSAVEYLKQFLPDGDSREVTAPTQSLGTRESKAEVFISYTLEPPQGEGDSGIPPGYEVPVDAIERFLSDKPVILLRDKKNLTFGSKLCEFMKYGASRPHVIVVHSDKYWRSPYCVFELYSVLEELGRQPGRDLLRVVIPVEHTNSRITQQEAMEEYVAYWNGYSGTPGSFPWPSAALKDHARSLVRQVCHDLSNYFDLNLKWSDGEAKVLAAIAERLELTSRRSHIGHIAVE